MSRYSLLPTLDGPLRRLLVMVPYWVLRYGHQVEIAPYLRAYEALLRGLPDDAEWVIATHAESEEAARAWIDELGIGGRSRIVTVPDTEDFTVWAQDACVVQRSPDDGGGRLLSPHRFDRHDDAAVMERVAESLDVPLERVELTFQGGNMLVGDDFWFLGADAVEHSLAPHAVGGGDSGSGIGATRGPDPTVGSSPGIRATRGSDLTDASSPARDATHTREEVERSFARLDSGRTLVVLGSDLAAPELRERPFELDGATWTEHIHRGSQQGSRQPLFDLDTFLSLAGRGPDGRYRVLVGDPGAAAELTGEPLPDHSLTGVFDDVADQLRERDFDVVRNPLPLVYFDDRVLRTRHWYFATSNNVIAQDDGARRTVWMPTYGDEEYPELRATDERNAETWGSLGFDVVRLPSFHVFARGLGAARCVCKCLDRGPIATRAF